MTRPTEIESSSARGRRVFALLLAMLLGASCEGGTHEPTGGETHFLTRCDAASTVCGEGLSCVCGVCTLLCEEQSACSAFRSAECVTPGSGACGAASLRHCDVECSNDSQCAVLSPSHRCEAGACRARSIDPNGGVGGASACGESQVSANEVLVLGDSFFASSHQVTAYLENLARSAGAITAGERYRDNSSITNNALAFGGKGIANQYANGKAEGPVKVVLMSGGGADVLAAACDPVDSTCPVLVAASEAARELFTTMAADGVLHVVFAFYPDPDDPAIRGKVDALRPLLKSACESSPVPCKWLDLRDTFAGHYPEYVLPGGIIPTDAGSQASAAAIWSIMRESCIAQ